ncbi:MAG: 6,7-dimethyl-8-ribityllumazine synthase [Nitriliruptoraceae bacterium]
MSGAGEQREASATGRRGAGGAARFPADVVDRLVAGALGELGRWGCEVVGTVRVPGAFEIPVVAQRMAASGRVDAVVALGCVIRGETPHFDHVCTAVTVGCEAVARTTGVPVGFGVLTVDDHAQADARAGGVHGDKGAEAAQAAVETALALRGW